MTDHVFFWEFLRAPVWEIPSFWLAFLYCFECTFYHFVGDVWEEVVHAFSDKIVIIVANNWNNYMNTFIRKFSGMKKLKIIKFCGLNGLSSLFSICCLLRKTYILSFKQNARVHGHLWTLALFLLRPTYRRFSSSLLFRESRSHEWELHLNFWRYFVLGLKRIGH